jgi:hypothetical protein
VLFYSLSGATKNDRGITSSPGTIGTGTTSPDLASVSDVIGQSQWDFTFDEPVTDVALDHFVVYSADGSAYSAKSFTRPSAEVVRIAIPELHEFPAKMVLAAVEDGAVKADDDSKTPSIIGARRIGTLSPATGLLSSGPELASFQTDDTTGQVRFVFNQPIDDDLTYEPKDFMVITPAGDLVQGRTFVEVKDNSVLMDFDKNIVEAAQGVAINEGAVKDYQGEKNPARTLMTTRSGIPAGTQSTLAPSSGPEIEKSSPSDSSTATASTPAPSVPAETQSGSSETQGDSTETPSNSTETPSNSTEIRRSPPETESRSQERPTTGQPVGAVR